MTTKELKDRITQLQADPELIAVLLEMTDYIEVINHNVNMLNIKTLELTRY